MANQEGNKKSGLSLLGLIAEFKQGMKGNICETSTGSWVLPLAGTLENIYHEMILR